MDSNLFRILKPMILGLNSMINQNAQINIVPKATLLDYEKFEIFFYHPKFFKQIHDIYIS